MSRGTRSRRVPDLLALAAATLTAAMAAVHGARPGTSHRRLVLVAAGLLLLALGVLSVASIGWPLVLAAVLGLTAGLRLPAQGRAAPTGLRQPGPTHG